MLGRLILEDNTELIGTSFGARRSVSGEVVFATGMVGYPESLTDPSYQGQILVLTYPLVGNYGVPDKKVWESASIKVSGLIVSNYIDTPSHYSSRRTLAQWLAAENIPALEIKDSRALTKKLREKGVMLGKISFSPSPNPSPPGRGKSRIPPPRGRRLGGGDFADPNLRNLVAEVSTKRIVKSGSGRKTVVVFDCGVKQNIIRELVKRKIRVTVVPWDYDIFAKRLKFDGIVISNGPGDPKMATRTIAITKIALEKKIPILGICLGNQILTLAAGGDTYKLKFGHRGQNHGAILVGTKRAYLTTQNHGFAVKKIPKGFRAWFVNVNDKTNEGIIHEHLPFMSVQFHPESHPGPLDTGWIFDEFIKKLE
ncbi:MAG: carbamoyl phosphate synthase small subunit [Candidatus Doudnabacteria bacterium RIFCSPHIGHO2_01_FULL_46_14]|uniref:Carbamoyl phosphate synthase small chain n=1 Tax=Candidatus Doudnabacteria bacterium RIFCSPHIGHO2_01_FULL_46_14 TaxID=1817824 RepID=A0A1F5NN14_9BACT|nr:MAG: carbamoyl phosphate synthase small subunit [Candidatus Doudnabacteria bacterium RIFCSPHIGHO2_01_FULL_46_14]